MRCKTFFIGFILILWIIGLVIILPYENTFYHKKLTYEKYFDNKEFIFKGSIIDDILESLPRLLFK